MVKRLDAYEPGLIRMIVACLLPEWDYLHGLIKSHTGPKNNPDKILRYILDNQKSLFMNTLLNTPLVRITEAALINLIRIRKLPLEKWINIKDDQGNCVLHFFATYKANVILELINNPNLPDRLTIQEMAQTKNKNLTSISDNLDPNTIKKLTVAERPQHRLITYMPGTVVVAVLPALVIMTGKKAAIVALLCITVPLVIYEFIRRQIEKNHATLPF